MAPNDPLLHLVDAVAEGDDIAVTELVRRTQPAVARLCTALGSGLDLDDLVQETYIRALRALPDFRRQAPVEMWLLTIARRVCADHVRRRQRERRLVERIGRLSAPAREDATTPADPVESLIACLDDDRREAFVLTQVVGLSYEEAAVVAGCPIGTIRSRVARARADLQLAVRRAEAQ